MIDVDKKIEIWCERNIRRNAIEINVISRLPGGSIGVLMPGNIQNINPGEEIPDSALSLKMNHAQILIDELWHCGLRPTEGTGSAGSLRATENHLADMRKICFYKLGMTNDH